MKESVLSQHSVICNFAMTNKGTDCICPVGRTPEENKEVILRQMRLTNDKGLGRNILMGKLLNI